MLPQTLPAVLGRYRLVELLGVGGMGAVYRAEQSGPLGFKAEVALKLVDPELAQKNPDLLLALADEAQLLSRVRHPNIVALSSFEEIEHPTLGNVPALILEYVPGETLDQVRRGPDGTPVALPPAAAGAVLRDSLAALDHAHQALDGQGRPLGLVHRDLKPGNVMIDRLGAVRLLDFGIAWSVDRLVQTGPNMTKGTLPYMSPEQLIGSALDGRSDLFVLGVIAFELLCGRGYVERPQGPRDLVRVARLLVEAKWADRQIELEQALQGEDLRRVVGLVAWVGRLLQRDCADRPKTARDALSTLDSLGLDYEAGRRWLSDRIAAREEEIELDGPAPRPGEPGARDDRPSPPQQAQLGPSIGREEPPELAKRQLLRARPPRPPAEPVATRPFPAPSPTPGAQAPATHGGTSGEASPTAPPTPARRPAGDASAVMLLDRSVLDDLMRGGGAATVGHSADDAATEEDGHEDRS